MRQWTAKFAKQARSEIPYLEFNTGDPIQRNDRTVDWQNGELEEWPNGRMAEYPLTQNALLSPSKT